MAADKKDPVLDRLRAQWRKRLRTARRAKKRGAKAVAKKYYSLARGSARRIRHRKQWAKHSFHPSMLNGHPGNITDKTKKAIVRGVHAGLVVTSTTDGTHSPGTKHKPYNNASGLGQAADMAAWSRTKMVNHQKAELARHRRGDIRLYELIGPDNGAIILGGAETDLGEGGALEQAHDNHDHVSPA